MVEFMAEHIRTVIDPDKSDLAEMLRAGGAYQEGGSVDTQLFKMYSGTFVSPLVDAMGNENIDAQQNYNHMLSLAKSENYVAAYYHLLMLLYATGKQMPPLFIAITADEKVLKVYVDEIILDFEDCLYD